MSDNPYVLYFIVGALVAAVAILCYQLGKQRAVAEVNISPHRIDAAELDRLARLIAAPDLTG